jgi:predicted transcriptional regulator
MEKRPSGHEAAGRAILEAQVVRGDSSGMDVLTALRQSPEPLSDDELAEMLGRDSRTIGQECRSLAFRGLVIREQLPNKMINKVYRGD